jgi:hypothetical protein
MPLQPSEIGDDEPKVLHQSSRENRLQGFSGHETKGCRGKCGLFEGCRRGNLQQDRQTVEIYDFRECRIFNGVIDEMCPEVGV